ncbi:hypothetical protein MFLAVUS_004707 [Mucor flavus]|uniref:Uncharacterized protein n=1 Tax=Mucor flavus TaxID=439312 RepID=A0ABP9YWN3_9FUNG
MAGIVAGIAAGAGAGAGAGVGVGFGDGIGVGAAAGAEAGSSLPSSKIFLHFSTSGTSSDNADIAFVKTFSVSSHTSNKSSVGFVLSSVRSWNTRAAIEYNN